MATLVARPGATRTLQTVAEYIEFVGWRQGPEDDDQEAREPLGPCSMLRAILRLIDDPKEQRAAVEALAAKLPIVVKPPYQCHWSVMQAWKVIDWNDLPGRKLEEVLEVLRATTYTFPAAAA